MCNNRVDHGKDHPMRDGQTSPARSRGTFNNVHYDELGAYLITPRGGVFFWPPRQCPGCQAMHSMFLNEGGKTECVGCQMGSD